MDDGTVQRVVDALIAEQVVQEHGVGAGLFGDVDFEPATKTVTLWDTTEGVAGVMPGYDRLGAAAVNLLASQLQHDERGVPDDPKIVQVEGRWRDGASLPVRSSVFCA